MKLGIIISQSDPETVWNAYRLGIFSLEKGDSVKVFLIGKGVESETDLEKFNVKAQVNKYIQSGGNIFACGSCVKSRNLEGSNTCPMFTMKDCYDIINESDKVVTF